METNNLRVDKALKKLDIGYKKICDCPDNHINCLTAKEWIKNQIGVWQFYYEGRDIRDKNLHPATFPISLSRKCIELFTHKGELVVDPFVGSGTTLVAARDLNRNSVGFDLHESYIELCKKRISLLSVFNETEQIAICDRTNIVNRIGIFGWPSNYITMGTTFEYILHFIRSDN